MLDAAMHAYTDACLNAELASDERRRAAREFGAIAQRVVMSDSVIAHAARTARLGEGWERTVAARLLTAAPDARAASALLAAYEQPSEPTPNPELLAGLGLAAPLPSEAWRYFDRARPAERGPLARALLRQPTPEGEALLATRSPRMRSPPPNGAICGCSARSATGRGVCSRICPPG
jgi:hypothetical protein